MESANPLIPSDIFCPSFVKSNVVRNSFAPVNPAFINSAIFFPNRDVFNVPTNPFNSSPTPDATFFAPLCILETSMDSNAPLILSATMEPTLE